MEVRLRPSALEDLTAIIDYIAPENPIAALRIVDEIEVFCMTTLADNPTIAPLHDEILADIRIMPVAGYRICYFLHQGHC